MNTRNTTARAKKNMSSWTFQVCLKTRRKFPSTVIPPTCLLSRLSRTDKQREEKRSSNSRGGVNSYPQPSLVAIQRKHVAAHTTSQT